MQFVDDVEESASFPERLRVQKPALPVKSIEHPGSWKRGGESKLAGDLIAIHEINNPAEYADVIVVQAENESPENHYAVFLNVANTCFVSGSLAQLPTVGIQG
jgi:hypothetical protein